MATSVMRVAVHTHKTRIISRTDGGKKIKIKVDEQTRAVSNHTEENSNDDE